MKKKNTAGGLFGFAWDLQSAKLEKHRGERFNSHQEPHYHPHNHHSDHHNHHDQHFNNPNYHPNHHDQHFNNPNYHHHQQNYQPDYRHHQHPDHSYNHHHHVIAEPNDLFVAGGFPPNGGAGGVGVGEGAGYGPGSGYFGRKRWRHQSARGASPDQVDGVGHVKLYVVPVPRTATEADIRPVFEEHGNIVEVVILKDKRTGQQQGSCFVKYATIDEAEGAIRALNHQYTFAGEMTPLLVKYADRERERLGVLDKLYVGCLNKDASAKEIEEIFSPYGLVEDIFIMRDELKQSRGSGFVKFSHRDMALAAIKALNGTFMMRGCDQPLIVRFADPKKPRTGEPRGNHGFASANFTPFSKEPFARLGPNVGDGGCILPNASFPIQPNSTSSLPQAVPQMINQEPIMQQPFPSLQQSTSELSQMSLQQMRTPQTSSQSSQLAVSEVQRQSHQTDKVEQQLSLQVTSQQSPRTGSNPPILASTSSSPAVPLSPQIVAPLECDWSEHTCPDGYKYYYNCVTYESRWEKPGEYTSYELQLQKQQSQQNPSHQLQSSLPVFSTERVVQTEQELNHMQLKSESNPVIRPTCA
ncbi:flowering time control protein FCA-like [Carya illinoinensis]|uniref:flowering time control protein FCA-like n=1 Tax=Carya illinoinensis TaxID=32201 RepID=UPI001C71E43B|nr:flowering time control protein FCA-like [Carya illinoinensis]